MAARQQQQIEAQQSHLVAKEQRLKYLKQQEYQQHQMATEYDRLRRWKTMSHLCVSMSRGEIGLQASPSKLRPRYSKDYKKHHGKILSELYTIITIRENTLAYNLASSPARIIIGISQWEPDILCLLS